MKVWYIEEERRGFIGLASSYEKAVERLIKEDWLNEGTMDGRGCSIEYYFGANWKKTVLEGLTVGDLEKFGFHLREVTVYD